MFIHLFINKLKVLLRNRTMIFWGMAFPFVLATFFYFAFANVDEAYKFNTIDLGVVDNLDNNLVTIIDSLSTGENKVFNTTYSDLDTLSNMLNEDKIDGYILSNNNEPNLVIKENGINQTIIKYVLDEYYQMSSVASNLIEYNPENMYNGILNYLNESNNYIVDKSSEKLDFTINYFFTLIAMACLYGSLIGLEIMKDSEANLSTKGARVCISPISKLKIILSGLCAGFIIQVFEIGLLFLYLIFALDVNFGSQVLPTIILTLFGCLAGTTLGTFVAVSNKKSEEFKIGLLTSIILPCCFFSGMMGHISIKTFFDNNFPLFSKINPINIITDGLYSLFAYDTLDVYFNVLIRLIIFSIVFIILTFMFIRRKNYDSI